MKLPWKQNINRLEGQGAGRARARRRTSVEQEETGERKRAGPVLAEWRELRMSEASLKAEYKQIRKRGRGYRKRKNKRKKKQVRKDLFGDAPLLFRSVLLRLPSSFLSFFFAFFFSSSESRIPFVHFSAGTATEAALLLTSEKDDMISISSFFFLFSFLPPLFASQTTFCFEFVKTGTATEAALLVMSENLNCSFSFLHPCCIVALLTSPFLSLSRSSSLFRQRLVSNSLRPAQPQRLLFSWWAKSLDALTPMSSKRSRERTILWDDHPIIPSLTSGGREMNGKRWQERRREKRATAKGAGRMQLDRRERSCQTMTDQFFHVILKDSKRMVSERDRKAAEKKLLWLFCFFLHFSSGLPSFFLLPLPLLFQSPHCEFDRQRKSMSTLVRVKASSASSSLSSCSNNGGSLQLLVKGAPGFDSWALFSFPLQFISAHSPSHAPIHQDCYHESSGGVVS